MNTLKVSACAVCVRVTTRCSNPCLSEHKCSNFLKKKIDSLQKSTTKKCEKLLFGTEPITEQVWKEKKSH
jgi:hypothetical protein